MMKPISSVTELPPYGSVKDQTYVAHCTYCGYRHAEDLYLDKRGLPRCLTCGTAVRTQPMESRINRRRRNK